MKNAGKPIMVFFALILSLSLLLSACGGNGNNAANTPGQGTNQTGGDQNQPNGKTLRILTNVVGGKDPEEMKLFEKEVERLSGIKVSMEKPPSDYDKKLINALSSGQKYDLIYLTKPVMDILVDQGALMPLTDKIKNSQVLSDPAVIPTEEWDLIRYPDGQYYGVFNKFEGGTMPIVRADWLKKLNLPEPKTLDDFYNVFKAFKTQDPDGNKKEDTYGLSTAGLYDIQGFMSAAGVKYKYVIQDGKRTIPYATEAAVPVYEWFAKLYKDGLLDPNFATNDTGKMRELFLTDRVGMVTYWDAWVGLFNHMRKTEDPNTTFEAKGIAGAPGPDGKIILRRGDPSLWAIPANAENPDLAFQFLEFWHTEKGNIVSTLGIEGHDYKVTNGKYELTDIGTKHSLDHGVVFPNNTKWVNPFGTYPGVKEAQQIILDNKATVEVSTAQWPDAEKIVAKYAYKAMMGEISAKEAVQKMNEELKAANLID